MTKQQRRTNLGLGIFAAAVFAGSILNWTVVAFLVAAVVCIATLFCFAGLWASMDDEWMSKQKWERTRAWKWVYDLVIMAMLFGGSMSGIGTLYAVNYVMAAYIKYRYNTVNRNKNPKVYNNGR